MSTIPGGCFVAPDSLRRLNQIQKQHAREAKLQATKSSTGRDAAHIQTSPVTSPVTSPTLTDQNKSTLTNMLTMAPIRLSELWGRSRSPQSSPPATPPASPKVLHSPLAESAPMLNTKSKLAENNNNKEILNPFPKSL